MSEQIASSAAILRPPQEPELFHLLSSRLRARRPPRRHHRDDDDDDDDGRGHGVKPFDRWSASDDDALRSLVDRYPRSVAVKYPFDSSVRLGGVRPIYAAVAVGASAAAVESLCDACPGALADRSACGWSVLHCACAYGAPLDVMRVLVDRGPESLAARDVKKMTPLHSACEVRPYADVISFLIRARPESLRETACSLGVYGQTPLHVACGLASGFEAVRALVSEYPEATSSRDGDGRLPLHLACSHCLFRAQNLSSVYRECPLESRLAVVRLLLEEYPNAVKFSAGRKWGTPLALARNRRISSSSEILDSVAVVDQLIDTDPSHADFALVLGYFKTIGWAEGVSVAFGIYPNFRLDLKLVPQLLRFVIKNRLSATFHLIKNMPEIFETMLGIMEGYADE